MDVKINFIIYDIFQPIYTLFLESADGKTILAAFKTNERLKKTTRSLLSRIVLKKEKDEAFVDVVPDGEVQALDSFV